MAGIGLADHYGVLEVDREADEATVKRAYRRLVLQWHPDKHANNREVAEEKIRDINDAYETLGNPFKRGQYDQQVLALERKARGYRLDTTMIKPRMSIPKEFMLSPMGHPDKFVRMVGLSLFVQSRSDVKMDFSDFFKDAKFSLWWLPEINNMCRLRPTSTAGVGQGGGMNFNFMLHRTCNVSEVVLSPGTMPDNTNVIAVASPDYQGAFRFESAQFPGHYLAYKPPTHLRMVGGIVDDITTIDFTLVDYTKMFNYITAEEVLFPAVSALGGDRNFVPLNALRSDANVVLYFQNVLRKAMWADDDFETFFESRSGEWDYDVVKCRVRLRPKYMQLENSLRRARTPAEIAAAISAADNYDVCLLRLETLEAVLCALGQPPSQMADVTLMVNTLDAQKKILVAIPKACEKDVSFRHLMTICAKVAAFGGDQPDPKVAERRDETARELGDLVADKIRYDGVGENVPLSVLTTLCHMPLNWRTCGERLGKLVARRLDGQPLETVLPLLRSVVAALPASKSIAERLADISRGLFHDADPAAVAEALEAMVSGGLCLEAVAGCLGRVLQSAPFSVVTVIVAGLGEIGMDSDEFRTCSHFVGSARTSLEALPPTLLLRLCVAATKSPCIAETTLDAVAGAAALTLPAWSADDASKLLLAVAKAKTTIAGRGMVSLYSRASEVLSTRLQEFSSVQLIKVALAIGQVPACRLLLESVAIELAFSRLTDLPSAQLHLLTQSLLPLGSEHRAMIGVLDHWASNFAETTRQEALLTESLGLELVRQRRGELEGKGQLNADQLGKLAQMLAPVAPHHQMFWKAMALRFVGQGEAEGVADALTHSGKVALQNAFPCGGGPEFEGKADMMNAVRNPEQFFRERAERAAAERGQGKEGNEDGQQYTTNNGMPLEPRKEWEGSAVHAAQTTSRDRSGSASKRKRKRRRSPATSASSSNSRSMTRKKHRERTASAKEKKLEKGRGRDRDRGNHKDAGRDDESSVHKLRKEGKRSRRSETSDAHDHGVTALDDNASSADENLQEQKRRLRQRERRMKLNEEKEKAKADQEDRRRQDAEEQGKRRLLRERRLKLKQDEDKERQQEAEAEAEKRRLQRERRKGRVALDIVVEDGPAIVQLD